MTIAALSSALQSELTKNAQDTTAYPIRNHALKATARSMAHARHAILANYEPTLSQRLGLGTHSLLLGGPPVLCCPTKQRRGKEYDAWLDKQVKPSIVLSKREYDASHRMNDAIHTNKLASQVLFVEGTIYEQTIEWTQLGRARRCTPDARTTNHLVDLKTTRDASPDRFRWDVAKYGYDMQLADYAQAIEAQSGLAPRRCYIVAVESKPPYLCTVHLLTPGTIQRAQRRCIDALTKVLECERTGIWPGYSDEILDLDVPDQNLELVFDDDESEDDND